MVTFLRSTNIFKNLGIWLRYVVHQKHPPEVGRTSLGVGHCRFGCADATRISRPIAMKDVLQIVAQSLNQAVWRVKVPEAQFELILSVIWWRRVRRATSSRTEIRCAFQNIARRLGEYKYLRSTAQSERGPTSSPQTQGHKDISS